MKKISLLLVCVFLFGCTNDPSLPVEKKDSSLLKNNEEKLIEDLDKVDSEITNQDIDALIEKINADLESDSINRKDILQGWYLSAEGEKKANTPSDWESLERSEGVFWISPDALSTFLNKEKGDLCESTGGQFKASCLEVEQSNCEYIPKSECSCDLDTKWNEKEGCLLVDRADEWIEIDESEKKQGWYEAQKNQKKQGTPSDWVWIDWGKSSRWMKK